MQGTIDGKDVRARDESFTALQEEPNVYRLESGVLVRVKTSVAKIGRQIDDKGDFKKNQYGDPAVLVRYAVEIVTSLEEDNASE